jgi:cyclophilin family peptidyl-prolyl cis-trans isomerase
MPNKKYVHPLISGSVLFVGLLSAITFAGIYSIVGKVESARDRIVVQNYRSFSQLYEGFTLITNIGRVDVAFTSENSPVSMRNFSRMANAGIFDNTLLRADTKTKTLQTGLSAQQINLAVIKKILGRGQRLHDKENPSLIQKGMMAMRFNSEDTLPVLLVVLADGTKLPQGFQVFGTVKNRLDIFQTAYDRDRSEDTEDLPVLIRRVELDTKDIVQ